MTDDAIERALERRVTPDELRSELRRAIGRDERDEVLTLIRWFTTRYASPDARLAYVRQAYARWTAGSGPTRVE